MVRYISLRILGSVTVVSAMSRSLADKLKEANRIDAYRLGDTFSREEADWLMPRLAALNSAIIQHFCLICEISHEHAISVGQSRHGRGMVCANGVPRGKGAAVYYGTLQVAERYEGRSDYAIKLPKLEISPKVWKVMYLCGFDARDEPYNAVMINHVCSDEKVNVIFELVDVEVYMEPLARRKKRILETKYLRSYDVPAEKMESVLFSYFAVIATVVKKVSPGGELLVSYNRPVGLRRVRVDHSENYFMPLRMAKAAREKENERIPGSDHVLVPCTCDPAGCPGNRFFLLDRKFLPQPVPSSSLQLSLGAPPAP